MVQEIEAVEKMTQEHENFQLNIALGYGGRAEIIDAVREISTKVQAGELAPEQINEELFRITFTPRGCLTLTSSSGPPAKSACQVFCFGRVPIRNCISLKCFGLPFERSITGGQFVCGNKETGVLERDR